jgi:hypothetical protein
MVPVSPSVKHYLKSISLCFSEINGIKKETAGVAVKGARLPALCLDGPDIFT